MPTNDYYEQITEQEANFLIDLYEAVSDIVFAGRPVTLVGIAYILHVKPKELADYLPQITHILDKVEQQYKIQQVSS